VAESSSQSQCPKQGSLMRLSRSPQLTAVCKNLRAYRKVDRSTNGRAEVMVSPTIGGKHLVRHRLGTYSHAHTRAQANRSRRPSWEEDTSECQVKPHHHENDRLASPGYLKSNSVVERRPKLHHYVKRELICPQCTQRTGVTPRSLRCRAKKKWAEELRAKHKE
jgi:hypothetical protein